MLVQAKARVAQTLLSVLVLGTLRLRKLLRVSAAFVLAAFGLDRGALDFVHAAVVAAAAAGAEDAAFAFTDAVLAGTVVRGLVVAVVGWIVFLARRRGAFRGVVDVVVVGFRRHN